MAVCGVGQYLFQLFMCDDDGGLVEHVKATNMLIDTAIRPGNWWGNGEAILMEALPSAAIIPKEQKPCRATPVNYRDIVLENISCTTENAIGAIGTGSNYENVVFRNVSVQMKEAKYMHLKGHAFDAAPASDVYEIPEDCAIYINGADVQLENTIAAPFRGKEQTTVKV